MILGSIAEVWFGITCVFIGGCLGFLAGWILNAVYHDRKWREFNRHTQWSWRHEEDFDESENSQ